MFLEGFCDWQCVFLVIFLWLFKIFGLFVCSVSFAFILFVFVLDVCLLSNEREKTDLDLGGWEDLEKLQEGE